MFKIFIIFYLFLNLTAVYAQTDTEKLDLSDEDRNQLQNYSSDSYNQKALEELCDFENENDNQKDKSFWDSGKKNKLSDACKGRSVKTFGVDDEMLTLASQAYSKFSVMLSGGNLLKNSGNNAAEKAASTATTDAAAEGAKEAAGKAKKKPNQKIDVCGLIGAGTEMVSGYQQQQYQKYLAGLPTNANNLQTESLIKIKKDYREKAKNKEINSVGWSSTAVCYLGQYASGTAKPGTWLKLTASGFLGLFNGFSAKDNKEMADELNVVIQKMPQKGDCNPITETHCFCNLPENINNEKYCMPEIRARNFRKYGSQMACLDRFGRPDGDCKCRGTNSCFDVTYMNTLNGLSFGSSYEEASKKAMSQISRGIFGKGDKLGKGDLATSAINKIKNTLKRIANKPIGGGRPLNSLEKKQVQLAHKLGIPKNLTAALVRSPKADAKTLAKTKSFFGGAKRNYKFNKGKTKSRIQSFSRADNFSMTKKKSRGRSNRFDVKSLLKKNQRGSRGSGGKIMKFAEKARGRASISKRKNISIFKIISRRYQLTSEQRLK